MKKIYIDLYSEIIINLLMLASIKHHLKIKVLKSVNLTLKLCDYISILNGYLLHESPSQLVRMCLIRSMCIANPYFVYFQNLTHTEVFKD